MDGSVLESSSEERDLGIRVNISLKPSNQCLEAANRARRVLTQISKAFHYRTKGIFLKLYKTYVRPHLEFSVSAWCPWTVADMTILENVQRRAVNMISGLNGNSYEEKLIELNLESLADRRTYIDLVQTFKILNSIDRVDYRTWFTIYGDLNSRVTRQSDYPLNLVRSEVSRTEVRNNFYSQRIINNWNSLPSYVKESITIAQFKTNYKLFKGANGGFQDARMIVQG